MAHDIHAEQFKTEVLSSEKPVIVDVYAQWCGPCKQMAPLFDELSTELEGQYSFVKLNIDDERELAMEYHVSSIPTLLFFKGGKLVAREVGYMGKEVLREKITTHLG